MAIDSNSITLESLFKLVYIFSRSQTFRATKMIGPLIKLKSKSAQNIEDATLQSQASNSQISQEMI
jgi:hypothetical protein